MRVPFVSVGVLDFSSAVVLSVAVFGRPIVSSVSLSKGVESLVSTFWLGCFPVSCCLDSESAADTSCIVVSELLEALAVLAVTATMDASCRCVQAPLL